MKFKSPSIPEKYIIQTVPYHFQITDYGCGDASLEMVLNYFGPDINQLSIADVMRTSEEFGTLSVDIVRGGHFSPISSSVGIQFPNVSLSNGYLNTSFGLSSFWRDSDEFWLDSLKVLIANDVPVIILMHFAPNGTNDGHFRVVVGYDDINNQIIMNDPWNRDNNPPIAVWSYADFQNAWYYFEPASPRTRPYFGAVLMPWIIDSQVTKGSTANTYNIDSTILYPCPQPFNCSQYPSQNVLISLQYDIQSLTIQSSSSSLSPNSPSSMSFFFPSLNAGFAVEILWTIQCLIESCSGMELSIKATGIVMNTTPSTFCCNSTSENLKNISSINYQQYSYTDIIGGQSFFQIP